MVTVDRNGEVAWVEPGAKEESPAVTAAAVRALHVSRFKPARTKAGRTVADWAEVNVEVRP